MTCLKCSTENEDDARFCCECGILIGEKPPVGCVYCQASPDKIDSDGFCNVCGQQRAVNEDTRIITLSPRFAACSNKGKKHQHNEDSFEIGACNGSFFAVLCDGVSTSDQPAEASRRAATAAKKSLSTCLDDHNGTDVTVAIKQAISVAETAVQSIATIDDKASPSASTIIIAIANEDKITFGWLGDTRAYFIQENKSTIQLTKDHSWANEQIDAGLLSPTEAMKSKQAHSITKSLGGTHDTGLPDEPSFIEVPITKSGWLLLCTDGLWNYTDALHKVLAESGKNLNAEELTQYLVQWANDRGGRDNITVIALRLTPKKTD